MSKRNPPFVVINGDGVATKKESAPKFSLVPRQTAAPAVQLGLLGFGGARSSVVSVGLDGLRGEDVETLLRAEGIRHIADIRVSPTFRGQVGAAVERALAASSISYHYFPALSDRFIGLHGSPWEHRMRYVGHLQECRSDLERLGRLVKDGPLLLLSWVPGHSSSDRALVLEALRGTIADFTLRLADDIQP